MLLFFLARLPWMAMRTSRRPCITAACSQWSGFLRSSINTPGRGHRQLLITCSGKASNKWCISKTNLPLNPNISVTIYFPPVGRCALTFFFPHFFFFNVAVAGREWKQPKVRTYLIALVYCCLKWGESSVWAARCWHLPRTLQNFL